MAKENFLTYTESDALGRLTETQDRVTITSETATDNQIWLVNDKGIDYFNGSFTHLFTIYYGSASAYIWSGLWGLANDLNDIQGLIDTSKSGLFVEIAGQTNRILILSELDGGTRYSDSPAYTLSSGTVYYAKVVRDESVGTYGTIYLYLYSDAARTVLLNTYTITLHTSLKDFRYIFASISYDRVTESGAFSGYVEDLELVAALTAVVTTQPCSSIASTTATGNGILTNLGNSAVTQHGHCWATTTNPTTADSKTTNGAGSLGAFTSAITGLTPGTKYYVRAYATNSYGTVYGVNQMFISGESYSLLEPGNIAVKTTTLRYVGQDGIEYYIQGTAV